MRVTPDFSWLSEDSLQRLERKSGWLEFKVLMQFNTLFADALVSMEGVCTLASGNTKFIGVSAARRGDFAVLDITMKRFNSYIEACLTAHRSRVLSIVLHDYRLLAEFLLAHGYNLFRAQVSAEVFTLFNRHTHGHTDYLSFMRMARTTSALYRRSSIHALDLRRKNQTPSSSGDLLARMPDAARDSRSNLPTPADESTNRLPVTVALGRELQRQGSVDGSAPLVTRSFENLLSPNLTTAPVSRLQEMKLENLKDRFADADEEEEIFATFNVRSTEGSIDEKVPLQPREVSQQQPELTASDWAGWEAAEQLLLQLNNAVQQIGKYLWHYSRLTEDCAGAVVELCHLCETALCLHSPCHHELLKLITEPEYRQGAYLPCHYHALGGSGLTASQWSRVEMRAMMRLATTYIYLGEHELARKVLDALIRLGVTVNDMATAWTALESTEAQEFWDSFEGHSQQDVVPEAQRSALAVLMTWAREDCIVTPSSSMSTFGSGVLAQPGMRRVASENVMPRLEE